MKQILIFLLLSAFCSCTGQRFAKYKQTRCWYAKNEQTHYYKHVNNNKYK